MQANPRESPSPTRKLTRKFSSLWSSAPLGRLGLAAIVAAASLITPEVASANGRFPVAGLIAVDPSDPSHLVVRATYGVLVTRDAGANFHWLCESAIGYGGYEDPMIAILADGSLVAGLFKGLSSSKNGGCDWDLAGGDLTNRYVVDLSAERVDPSKVVLVVSSGVGAGQFLTQLWESADSASTWTKAGPDLPVDFLALTVDTAPSDRTRVYLSGRSGATDSKGVIQRSKDRGQTWESFDVPGSNDRNLPFIGAVDPHDPDTLYLRLDGDPNDTLVVSHDGGETFETAFTGQGNLLGFALSPDGSTALIGGAEDGMWSAPTSTLKFEQISDVAAKCLTWVDAGLFACGDEAKDGFTVGVSSDAGKSFSPLLHLDGLCGPLECPSGSDVVSVCDDSWGATRLVVGSRTCGDGAGGEAPVPDPDPGPAADTSSCGCRLDTPADEGTPRDGGAVPLLLTAAAVLTARRPAARRRLLRSRPRSLPASQ